MSDLVIWHNPRCSKSRQALALLEQRGLHPTVRRYLEDAPSIEELCDALGKLGLPAARLVRKGEVEFKDLGLERAEEAALIAAMAAHPRLIERPVVFFGGKAAIGRPPEAVLDLFG